MIPSIPINSEFLNLTLGAFFSLVGLLIFLFMILSKIIYFFLNILNNYLPKKAKLKIETKTKSFYIALIGVCFIITLSLAAHNWFIYGLAIVIIATLVTELEFLEKVVALFWNRKDYWEYRTQLDGKNLQSMNVTTEEKIQLENAAAEEERTDETANDAQNQLLLMYHSEKMYRLIFGSQIGILQWLALNEDQGRTKFQIEEVYKNNPLSASYPLEGYLGFLENNKLIQFNPISLTYTITPVGKFFLDYLVKNQISTNKSN